MKPNNKDKSSHDREPKTKLPSAIRDKVGASASQLLRSSLSNPPPETWSGALASLNPGGAKGASSQASTAMSQASSSAHVSSGRGHDLTSQGLQASRLFRSGQERLTTSISDSQAKFNEFIDRPHSLKWDSERLKSNLELDGMLPTEPNMTAHRDAQHGNKQEEHAWSTKSNSNEDLCSPDDGAAVVALLSDPSFTIGEEPNSCWDFPATEEDNQFSLVSPQLTGSRDALVPTKPLDFLPDFSSPLTPLQRSKAVDSDVQNEDSHIQPWIDASNRYVDEVWGDILLLEREVRKEADQSRDSREDNLRKISAIQRLRMLLSHMQMA